MTLIPCYTHFTWNASSRHVWWHGVQRLIAVIVTLELVVLCIGLFNAWQPSEISIARRIYPAVPYEHFAGVSPEVTMLPQVQVYHITKEFGPASLGGLGTQLTTIATTQWNMGQANTSVIIPHYPYLDTLYTPELVSQLSIPVRSRGRWRNVSFKVHKIMYPSHDPNPMAIYLIGCGNRSPFDKAFRAAITRTEIYTEPSASIAQLSNLFFSKAAAAFLEQQSQASSEPMVVHIHGATNAMVADFLRDTKSNAGLVYTMHDYTFEVEYFVTADHLLRFRPSLHDLAKYQHGNRVFLSALGIDTAQVVTIVSQSLASSIVSGTHQFHFMELIMENLLEKTVHNRFIGINNGVDLEHFSPFKDAHLRKLGLAYPEAAQRLLSIDLSNDESWASTVQASDRVTTYKDRAKQYLMEHGLLHPSNKDRPIVLFVGRMDYAKGLDRLDAAMACFVENNMALVIAGQPNSYPLEKIMDLKYRYPDHLALLLDQTSQDQWLSVVRAAADFAFVPSRMESFGLVAVEGLLYGAPVISSGVGGLAEFLVDRPRHDNQRIIGHHNAYLFNVHNQVSLENAIHVAVQDYRRLSLHPDLHEAFVLHMIKSAGDMSWTRPGGPAEDYIRVYRMALEDMAPSVDN